LHKRKTSTLKREIVAGARFPLHGNVKFQELMAGRVVDSAF